MIHSKSNRRYQFMINVILIIVTIIMVAPIILLFMSSISSERSLLVYGYSFVPKEFSLEAYQYIFSNAQTIFRAYGITILVTIVGTACNLILSSMTAYALSVRKLPCRNVISFYIFFTMLFNGGLVPSYLMWTSIFHIKNTIFALIVPNFMLSAMNVILIRTYYSSSIPEALYEAAKIDGSSELKLLLKVVLPMSLPIIATVGLLVGLGYWNDWLNGLYYVNDDRLYSIQVLLNKMLLNAEAMKKAASAGVMGGPLPSTGMKMAVAVLGALPVLVMYPFFQKYFVKGITVGAVKG